MIYRGDEVVLTFLDNYKPEARAIYTQKFSQMLQLFRDTIPTHRKITLRYELTSETSLPKKLFPFMEQLFPKYLKHFEALPKEEQAQKILRSYRNHMWNGHEDLTKLSEQAKIKHAKWAYIMHDAFLEADVTLAKKYFENGISISFNKKLEGCIHYGSCLTSCVQFWAGEGFLSKKENTYLPWILSYEQQQEITSNLLPVSHPKFKKLGLKSIRLYEHPRRDLL
ncbi:MAG: hypothetical protein ACR2LN_02800 [Candidatus Levyibacteriota bacterium]